MKAEERAHEQDDGRSGDPDWSGHNNTCAGGNGASTDVGRHSSAHPGI